MIRTKTPYWLIFKRYWRPIIGISAAWFLVRPFLRLFLANSFFLSLLSPSSCSATNASPYFLPSFPPSYPLLSFFLRKVQLYVNFITSLLWGSMS